MFAVPGWAVSANSLKTETSKSTAPPAPAAPAGGQNEANHHDRDNKSKKRKRSSGPTNVTSANVADLWERVIEGKSGKKPKANNSSSGAKDPKKKQKNGHVKEQPVTQDGDDDEQPRGEKKKKKPKREEKKEKKLKGDSHGENHQDGEHVDGAQSPASAKKNKKDKKKSKQTSETQGGDGENQKDGNDQATATAAAAAPPAPKLTPLQAAMREKLISARFRHLNETLYTRPSAEAFQLFQDSPEMFREYHEGFRRQVDVWPENPVDGYIAEIQLRGRQKTPAPQKHRDRNPPPPPPPENSSIGGGDSSPSTSGVPPLPRTNRTCTIADLGCGDAKLAAALEASKRKLRLDVLSYDLHGESPRVTRADVADLPRPDASVDVAILCLALMGTNWLDFVEEAYRVLRWKGELWVAEIQSRFASPSSSSSARALGSGGGGGGKRRNNEPVSHSVGNRRKAGAAGGGMRGGGKKNGEDDGAVAEDHETDLAVEVDGAEDRRGETDVSGFVEALRRRGFVLQGEPDLRNRMFVRMRFVKAAPAMVGKCARAADSIAAPPTNTSSSLGQKRNALKRFLDGGGAGEDRARADESAILKPCVYKIR